MPETTWKSTDAGASGTDLREKHRPKIVYPPTFPQLCAITRYVLSADPCLGLPGTDEGDLEEAVKIACARAGFAYSTRAIEPAVKAVLHVHRVGKRYALPRMGRREA